MSEVGKILKKAESGEDVTYDDYQKLLQRQEEIDDALEIVRGAASGARSLAMESAAALAAAAGGGLAIVVGHTTNSPGASGGSPINQSEYPWNKDLADKIKAECAGLGVTSKIFFRDNVGISGAYAAVAAWGAQCVMELHFNSFNGAAKGTETLYDNDKNAGSKSWAQKLQTAMLGALGTNDRGLKECDAGDRGFGSVSALNIPSALIEPFFGDNQSDAQKGLSNKTALAKALAKAAATQLNVA